MENTSAEKKLPLALTFGENKEWAVSEDDGCLRFHPQWNTDPHKTSTYIWQECFERVEAYGGFDELVKWFRKKKLENS